MARRLNIGLLALATALVAVFSWPAHGQVVKPFTHLCMGVERMSQALKKAGETRRGDSVGPSGELYVFWLGKKSWTLIRTTPDGESCIAGAGEEWRGHVPGNDA